MSYQDTNLWRTFEAFEGDRAKQEARRLAEQFIRSREHALLIAAEINRDFPDLTQHDISHIDALWGYADLICGEEYILNPAELYVLGISFLVHDLANGLAAIPGGLEALSESPRWRDVVAAEYRALHGVYPSPGSLTEAAAQVRERAIPRFLRETHAEYAATLPQSAYPDHTSGQSYYLIEDIELRTQYGHLAGRIAASHWWPSKALRQEFDVRIGARASMPDSWQVDPLVLACILRCADAAHLDSRRAPGLLRAVRKPSAESEAHWVFQDKLQKPHIKEDRLFYTSLSPFTREQSESWWLCYESLSALDHELSAVDSILSDSGRKRIQARSVAGIRDLEEISRNITTEGWHPIDARLKVTDVVSLVTRLGGKELYGGNPHVAIRELITNAADAVRAKKTMLEETGASPWEIFGDVTTALKESKDGTWLSVRDTGIGMSKDVLAGALLNFGTSYWDSVEARRDLPGLISSGFRPAGQFGIGFFSVFMIGDAVKVVSRRYDASADDTFVLEFKDGISRRPMLRTADAGERLATGGTEVQVLLKANVNEILSVGRSDSGDRSLRTFAEVCGWLCPALDVDLYVFQDGTRSLVVGADDWKTVDDEQLIDRLYVDHEPAELEELKKVLNGPLMAITTREGDVMARLAISRSIVKYDSEEDADDGPRYSTSTSFSAPIIVGGVRSSAAMDHAAGIVLGKPTRAARDIAVPLLEPADFGSWATRQALTLDNSSEEIPREALVSLIAELHGQTGELHIAESSVGKMTFLDVLEFCAAKDRIVFLQDAAWINYVHDARDTGDEGAIPRLSDDVLLASGGRGSALVGSRYGADDALFSWSFKGAYGYFIEPNSVTGLALRAIAQAWSVNEVDVFSTYDRSKRSKRRAETVGYVGDKRIRLKAMAVLERDVLTGGHEEGE
ncbi:ATP-binding protein [Streptomyces sp. NPDC046900]|uniref:HD domain-containing protein n=1 Tax=Streptomyces sp. NPDC046900 TaxID=3155473 RepID=UPI0033EFE605